MPSNIGKVRDSDSREPFSDTRYRSPGRQKDRLRSFFSLTFSISPRLQPRSRLTPFPSLLLPPANSSATSPRTIVDTRVLFAIAFQSVLVNRKESEQLGKRESRRGV